ncbi:MAPEG family protein [Neotabrizicola sp. VNH66]|uniref:MAPEG family protein n=1 Tax=Neotabrizicola sp. VNH66 TaxID=3400918 RepID=UPI003C08E748
MTPELAALSATALVHFASVMVAQRSLTRDIGRDGNMGTREGMEERLSPVTLRLRRANANFTENIGPFIIAVVVVVLAEKTSALTAALAWAYVVARILYVPAYAFAWVPGRSLIWSAGFFATLALLFLGLFG